jgi:hypothetical protein
MPDRLILEQRDEARLLKVYETSQTIEVFADGISGIEWAGGVVKFNLVTRPFQGAGAINFVERQDVAVRVVMSMETFVAAASALAAGSARIRSVD